MKRIGMVLCAVALATSACEKDSGLSSKTSGSLKQDENALLAHLPAGNVGLFGGNYLRIQDWMMSGAFSKFMSQMDEISPGMKTWTSCFAGSRSLKMLGGVSYTGEELTMRFVMKGFTVEEVKQCAQKAGFPVDIDADGKFVAIGMATAMGPVRAGYLVLPDGALFTRSAVPLPPSGAVAVPSSRADLEADIAAAARASAAQDTALVAEMARIDRDRAVWFVGDASSTPAGDQLGAMRGWLDVGNGLSIDVAVQLKDPAMADEIAKGIPQLKQQADMLGKDVASVVRGLKFQRKGDWVRFGLSISDKQLERMVEQMAPFMGGGGFGGF